MLTRSSSTALFFDAGAVSDAIRSGRVFVPDLVHTCLDRKKHRHADDDVAFLHYPTKRHCALLFVDVSGYSKLGAELAKQGPHALASAVNGYFHKIVDVILQHRGDVLKFAGDAVLAVWYDDETPDGKPTSTAAETACNQLAAVCALRLQEACDMYVCPELPDVALRLHIGVGTGPLESFVFHPPSSGDPWLGQKAFFYATGVALKGIETLVDGAPPGTVRVAKSVLDSLESAPGAWKVSTSDVHADNGSGLIRFVTTPEELPVETHETLVADALQKLPTIARAGAEVDTLFVPATVLDRLRLGLRLNDIAQLRKLYCLFIDKAGDGTVEVMDWFSEVHAVLAANRCPVTQVIEDDKGVHVIAALNLYGADDTAADTALRIVRALQEREIGCTVGVAGGATFCGMVGSESLCRWDITGATVIRACRLMQFAQSKSLAACIDASIVDDLLDPSQLDRYGTDATLKGSADPVPVYVLVDSANDLSVLSHLASMDTELATAEIYLPERVTIRAALGDKFSGNCVSAVVSGHPKTGKLTLVRSVLWGAGMTPIIHRLRAASKFSSSSQVFDLCRTLSNFCEHYQYHGTNFERIREAAARLQAAATEEKFVKSLSCAVDLIVKLREARVELALVVHHVEHADAMTLRLMSKLSSEFSARQESGSPRFALLLTITHSPEGVDADLLRRLGIIRSDALAVGTRPLDLDDFHRLFRNFTTNTRFCKLNAREIIKSICTPAIFLQYMVKVIRLVGELSSRIVQHEVVPMSDLAFFPNGNGVFTFADRCVDMARNLHPSDYADLATTVVMQVDEFPPHQQLFLKILACSTSTATMKLPMSIVSSVTHRYLAGATFSDEALLKNLSLVDTTEESRGGSNSERFVGFSNDFTRRVVVASCHPGQITAVAHAALRELEGWLGEVSSDNVDLVEHLVELAVVANSRIDAKRLLRALWGLYKQLGTIDLKEQSTCIYDSPSHRIAVLAERAGFTTEEQLDELFAESEVAEAVKIFTLGADAVEKQRTVNAAVLNLALDEQKTEVHGEFTMWFPPGRKEVLEVADHHLPAVPRRIPWRNLETLLQVKLVDITGLAVNNIYPPLSLGPMASLIRIMSRFVSSAWFNAKAISSPGELGGPLYPQDEHDYEVDYLLSIVQRYRDVVVAGLSEAVADNIVKEDWEGNPTLSAVFATTPMLLNFTSKQMGERMVITQEEESDLLKRRFKQTHATGATHQDIRASISVLAKYFWDVVRPRSLVTQAFVRKLSSVEVEPREDGQPHAEDLLTTVKALNICLKGRDTRRDFETTAVRDALMCLATSNWHQRNQYFDLPELRDYWLRGQMASSELVASFFSWALYHPTAPRLLFQFHTDVTA